MKEREGRVDELEDEYKEDRLYSETGSKDWKS
jgi:hypothetical protein